MKDMRGANQILYGFLPKQTVDLKGRVWRVRWWREPRYPAVDQATLRRELIKAAMPWSSNKQDGGYVADLYRGDEVRVLSLDTDNGVSVEPFPNVWMCKSCRRIAKQETAACKCGSRRFGQLPFVLYHDACGALQEPYVPRCRQHDDVMVVLPGTASASEIRFVCPECKTETRKGLGFVNCQCGKGTMTANVHRAASVYTPRTIVIVNPPSTQRSRRLADAGGASRALAWVVDGMQAPSFEEFGVSESGLRETLLAQGLPAATVERMMATATEGGEGLGGKRLDVELPPALSEHAEDQAVTIATATLESRMRVSDLENATTDEVLRDRYGARYRVSMARAGFEDIELIEKFPVLSGCFGYTRGGGGPGATRLVPFRDRSGKYAVHAEIGETEALFVRLRASRVAEWLRARGHGLAASRDERDARIAILSSCRIPKVGDDVQTATPGSDLLTLVHTVAHRFIRRTSVFAGVDRNALSELLVPSHLGFFVYAASRGGFVLGGLQAVFESELDRLLDDYVGCDHRCALDPGCRRSGGACMACIHLGEPSCRYYNCFLNRDVLFGPNGYLTVSASR